MNSIDKLKLRNRIYEVIIMVIAMVAVGLGLSVLVVNHDSSVDDKIELVSDGWYQVEKGIKMPVEIPCTIDAIGKDEIVLYNDNFKAKDAGLMLSTQGAIYELEIYCGNDQLLHEYVESVVPRNDQLKAKMDCDATIPADIAGKRIKFVYHVNGRENVVVDGIYKGPADLIMGSHFKASMLSMGGIVLILIVALFAICLGVYTNFRKMPDYRAYFMGIFLLICAIWFISDSYMIQRLFNLPNAYVLGFYALAALPIPFIHCVVLCEGMDKYRLLKGLLIAYYINLIAQGMLDYLDVCEVTSMLIITHMLLIVGIACSCFYLFKEHMESGVKELREILIGFALMAFLGVIALVLYWVLDFPMYAEVFELGTLAFVIDILVITVKKIIDNMRYRLEMKALEKLSRQDMLTGLGSRKAYDEYMGVLQTKIDKYNDVMIMFIDILDIKNINDKYGTNAGDELIATAGTCIDNTFGYAGKCFRLTGTEFCVIVTDPAKTETEWMAILDEQLAIANKTGKHKVRVVRGSSFIKGELGIKKTISDWKFEADQNMTVDKYAKDVV